jgi:uncharacterized membrane protein YsdA (DUF1294 family)
MKLININLEQIFFVILLAINIFSFCIMAWDKNKAINKNNTERSPEVFVFFLAIIFGSLGVYLGMFVFCHKIRKWYFQIGIPLLIIQNLTTIYIIWKIITES